MTTRTELIADERTALALVLRGGKQCDEDGEEIIMSRQACCVAADMLEADAEALDAEDARREVHNRYCDTLVAERDKLRAAAKLAKDALNKAAATCLDARSHQEFMSSPSHFMRQALAALDEALK
jgi:hypothetical protein